MEELYPVTCPFCNLHCNDLHLSFDGGRLTGLTPACSLSEAGFRRVASALAEERTAKSPLETDLRTARTWLREALRPLVVLSGDLDRDAVLAAVKLARKYSAILTCDEDCSGSVLGLSMQSAGFLSATLHELHDLSLVVLAGVEPASTHPRLGEFLGWDLGTDCLFLDPPDPLVALRWLRMGSLDPAGNIPAKFAEAANRIQAAVSGVVVFGPEWLKAGLPLATELLLWLRDLKARRPWYALYLAPAPNSTGVIETLLSETGYPGNLHFGPEQVDYSPRLLRAEHIIQQGDADLCLLVGQPGAFSDHTLTRLTQGRTILLDPDPPAWNSPVWLPSARFGVEAPGRFQRLDGVMVKLRSVLHGDRPLMKDLLLELTREEPPA